MKKEYISLVFALLVVSSGLTAALVFNGVQKLNDDVGGSVVATVEKGEPIFTATMEYVSHYSTSNDRVEFSLDLGVLPSPSHTEFVLNLRNRTLPKRHNAAWIEITGLSSPLSMAASSDSGERVFRVGTGNFVIRLFTDERNITFNLTIPDDPSLTNGAVIMMDFTIRAYIDSGIGESVGLWRFSEGLGTVAHDSSGNGLHGEIVDASWATGISGKGLQFDGSGMMNVGNDPMLTPSDAMTLEAWLYPTADGGTPGTITNGFYGYAEYDPARGANNVIVPVNGDIYAIVYSGPGADGFVRTVRIDGDGTIPTTGIDVLEFDTSQCRYPDVVHVSDDIYAIVYSGAGNDGYIATVEIDDNGAITDAVVDRYEYNTAQGTYPCIKHVAGDIYAVAYTGPGSDGFVATFEISASGVITTPFVDQFEYNPSQGVMPKLIELSNNYFAIVYRGPGNDGFLSTVRISDLGNIQTPVIDNYEFETSQCTFPWVSRIGGDIYSIAYAGPGTDGFLATVEIDQTGDIVPAVIDRFEFDTVYGNYPQTVHVAGSIHAISYTGNGNDGHLATVEISSDGSITDTIIDSYEFDTSNGVYPRIRSIDDEVYAVLYTGPGNDGFLGTINITGDVGIFKGGSFGLAPNTTEVTATINMQTFTAGLAPGWNHVVLTFNSSAAADQARLYVNGSEAATMTIAGTLDQDLLPFIAGKGMIGYVDEVRIYNRVLDASEISDRYDELA